MIVRLAYILAIGSLLLSGLALPTSAVAQQSQSVDTPDALTGQVGKRQSKEQLTQISRPLGRIESRLNTRIDNRLDNRIRRETNREVDASSAFEEARSNTEVKTTEDTPQRDD
ncbi:hypothetical protein [Altererythrobacter sp. Z27]|uniref:hypothetical protein n=1 Tax=Altererythrobacter sp. Z27 TaxID=3461147 RepID=UPI004043A760